MRQPEKFSIQKVYDNLDDIERTKKTIYINKGFAVSIRIPNGIGRFLNFNTPYLIEEYRMGFVKKGSFKSVINLKEYALDKGCMVFVSPGTIAEPIYSSEDLELAGVVIPQDMFHLATRNVIPDIFNGERKAGAKRMTTDEFNLINDLFDVLLRLVNTTGANTPETYGMISTIANCYNSQFLKDMEFSATNQSATSIFNRFINMVSANCGKQRKVGFYADKICVTERYLSTVISQTSGVTAKDWIDKAVITQAKLLLIYGNRQVIQIADELNFPNPSFFCKYFKRLVGCTPHEYRSHFHR